MRPRFTANARFAAHDAARLEEALADLPRAGSDLLIGLDLDGTTVRHDTSLSPRVKDAVDAHRAAGSHVILATGRGIAGEELVAADLGIHDGLAVCSNGAITIERDLQASEDGIPDGVHLLTCETFDPSPIIARISEELPQVLLAVDPARGPRHLSRPFPEGELQGDFLVVPVSELGGPDATRLTVRAPEMSAEELLHAVEAIGLTGVEYAIGWTAWLDFSPPGVTKATALEAIRSHLGIDPAATLTVGDGANDIDMLEWAHVGVAMGGVSERVLTRADAVTAPVDDDGLAIVLEFLLD